MKLLEEKILKEGEVLPGDVLKVGAFLNHQMDVPFLDEMCGEFYRLFRGEGVTKILTIEASGIGLACLTARYFGVPVVFAKKSASSNVTGAQYRAKAKSFTHGNTYDATVPKAYLSASDRVLIVDDFLAMGSALEAMASLVSQAGATLVGAGIAVEKQFEGGGDRVRARGVRVESLAKISRMQDGVIEFC